MESLSKHFCGHSLTTRSGRTAVLLFVILVFISNIFTPLILFADFNPQINYQGKLTDTDNLAVSDGDWRMYFRLYTVPVSGTEIWEEDRSTEAGNQVTITNGLFSVMLGSSTPLTSVDFNQELYLGVEICGLGSGAEDCDGEMSPRKILGAVPAAFESKRLSGLESWQFFRSDIENSTSTASAFLRITQSGAGNIADFVGQGSAPVMSLLSSGNVGVGTSTPYARFSVWGGSSDSNLFNVVSSASTTLFNVLSSGNVGVGTTSPFARFSVQGVSGGNGLVDFAVYGGKGALDEIGGSLILEGGEGGDTLGSAPGATGGSVSITAGRGGDSGAGVGGVGGSLILNPGVGGLGVPNGQSGNILLATSGGNVGVGTSSPYSRFSIWGSGTGTSRLFELTNSASTTLATFLEDGTGYFLGNIGIGTTTPGTILSLGNTGDNTINISTTATSTFGSGINIRTGCFAVNGTCVGGGGGVTTFLGLTDTQSSFTANRIIHTNSAGNALTDTNGFVFDGTNLGIGTTSPYARLSVAGQTVAEYFTATSITATSTLPYLSVTHGLSTPLTESSVVFIGAGGMLKEDNTNFRFTSNRLKIEGGLDVSATSDSYSHFGGSTANLPVSPSNTTDRLVTIKGVSGTSGDRRGLLTAVDFTGSSSNSGANLAFQSIAKHGGSGALTATTGAGGLSGGRAGLRLGSSTLGTISLATGLSIITERPDFTIFNSSVTELIGLQIESGAYSMGATGSITDYYGIRVRSPSSGTITNTYGLRIDEVTVGSSNRFAIYTGGTTKSYFGGNVGVGTTTPYSKLTVWGSGTGGAKIFELVNNASTTVFSVAENGTTEIGSATAGNIIFETTTSGNVVLVGMGTTTPDADLTIVSDQTDSNKYLFTIATTSGGVVNRKFTVDSDGDVAIDGSLTNPADYAEAFTVVGSKTDYEPGDIVVISKERPGLVEKSSVAYQANLAGVYSTKPGIIGTLAKSPTAYRIEEENDIPVGVMGRVPVKVSLENGPIKTGDYITSSSKAGVGMKATKPGRVVGIALEDFEQVEVGKIMVFINSNTFYFGKDGLNLDLRVGFLESLIAGSSSSGGFFSLFENMGIKIQEGLAYFKAIIAERLTIGSREKPAGITLFDEETGEPYCVSVKSGLISTLPGECRILDDKPDPDPDSGSGSIVDSHNDADSGDVISEEESGEDSIGSDQETGESVSSADVNVSQNDSQSGETDDSIGNEESGEDTI